MSNCNNTEGYIFKRSATFKPTVQFVPIKGGLQNLAGATLTCMVLDANGSRWAVNATLLADNITVQLYADAESTAKWCIGAAIIDLRYTINGDEELTDSLTFFIEEAATLRS